MFRSIRSKLMCIFAVFLAGFVLLQMLFNIFFAEKFYIMQKKIEINQVYNELKANYSDSHDELYSILNKYEEKYNVRVMIFARESDESNPEFFYASIPDWQLNKRDFFMMPRNGMNDNDERLNPQKKEPFENPRSIISDNGSFSENAKAVLLDNPQRDMKDLFLRGIIKTDGGDRYVIIESSVASIKQTVNVTAKINLFVLLGLMAAGMIYFYFYASKLTKPIKEVDEVAQSVVNLDFSKKAAETGGKDEIAHLASNINIMSDRICDMINELQTVNKKLEKDIEFKTKLENIRKEFVANVSHELKTPIALLMGYTEILKADVPGLDKEFYYDVIADESSKMNKLVTQLLDVSKMENELAELNYEPVDLYNLVLWTIEKNQLLLEKNMLEYSFEGENLECECDKMKIEQAITNYISNAIYHSPQGSKILIKLYKENENAVFSVYNEGNRINEEDMEKIWNIFYKADKSRAERKSTGLGLYIVSSVINAHKGEYGVKNLENGVEFYFKIKLNKD